jgi:hypothetical protein
MEKKPPLPPLTIAHFWSLICSSDGRNKEKEKRTDKTARNPLSFNSAALQNVTLRNFS